MIGPISKKNVVMQVQHTHIINCTFVPLQPHIDIFWELVPLAVLFLAQCTTSND